MTSVGKRLRWNRELHRLVMWFGIVFAVCIGIMNIGMGIYLEKLRSEHKVFLAVIFEKVSATYPDVDEEEFVKVLSGRVNTSQGEEILARYGVFGKAGSQHVRIFQYSAFCLFFDRIGISAVVPEEASAKNLRSGDLYGNALSGRIPAGH